MRNLHGDRLSTIVREDEEKVTGMLCVRVERCITSSRRDKMTGPESPKTPKHPITDKPEETSPITSGWRKEHIQAGLVLALDGSILGGAKHGTLHTDGQEPVKSTMANRSARYSDDPELAPSMGSLMHLAYGLQS